MADKMKRIVLDGIIHQLETDGIAGVPLPENIEINFPALKEAARLLFSISKLKKTTKELRWRDEFGPLGFTYHLSPSGDYYAQLDVTRQCLMSQTVELLLGVNGNDIDVSISEMLSIAFGELKTVAAEILSGIETRFIHENSIDHAPLSQAAGEIGSTLRVLNYTREPSAIKNWCWAKEHYDFGLLTFVLQFDVEGLEYLSSDNLWKSAPKEKLIVMTGELLSNWFGDLRIPLCRHRVVGAWPCSTRSVLVLFAHPDPEYVLPAHAVQRYVSTKLPVKAREYLQRRLEHAALRQVLNSST